MPKDTNLTATAQAQEDLRAAIAALKKAAAEEDAATRAAEPELRGISETIVAQIIALIEQAETLFSNWATPLLPIERKRLVSVAIKNLGFVQTAYNSAITHTALVPSYLNVSTWHNDMNDYLRKQQLLGVAQQLEDIISDSLYKAGSVIYEDALVYYNYLKTASREKVPGAEEQYALLKRYFKKGKRTTGTPTEAELERDFHSLLHRTKEGRLVIENKAPEAAQGKLTVTDDIEKRQNLSLTETYSERKE